MSTNYICLRLNQEELDRSSTMPDKATLPDDNDFTPLQIEIACQSLEAQLGKNEVKANFDKSRTHTEKCAWLWGQEALHNILTLEEDWKKKNNTEANKHRAAGQS